MSLAPLERLGVILAPLEQRLGVVFRDKHLLLRALTHRSFVNEVRGLSLEHNERLEFLGDAVLELVVTDYLFKSFPRKTEGELTTMRAFVVSGDRAAKIAQNLVLNEFLQLSKGERNNSDQRYSKVILADTFEAIIGALYLDQGYEAARRLIDELVLAPLEGRISEFKSAKCRLQEKVQGSRDQMLVYRLLQETGPDHEKHFRIGVYVKDKLLAEGEGSSKREAEQAAAERALNLI